MNTNRSLRSVLGLRGPAGLFAMLSLAACPRTRETTHADSQSAATEQISSERSAAEVHIDGPRMLAMVAALADDRLSGRFTLAKDDIGRAADMLATAYRDGNVVPVGTAHRVEYPVITGVHETAPAMLAVTRAGAALAVPAGAFVARPQSASATATGEVVFVGYAAKSRIGSGPNADPEDGSPSSTPPDYDDLAGVDLRGKIALCLLETPARPDADAMSEALREKAEAFEQATEAARAKKDSVALARAHVALRKDIAKMVAPWMRGKKLPKSFTAAPADPLAPVDVRGIIDVLIETADALSGPRFDPRAGRMRTKLQRLVDAGAVGVIFVEGPRSFVDASARAADVLPTLAQARPGVEQGTIPIVQMRWHDAEKTFPIGKQKLSAVQARIDTKLVPQSRVLTGTSATITVGLATTTTNVPNVLAQIPGSDRADEIVVIGAHFDHIGRDGNGQCHTDPGDVEKDGVCNGADDNASGTAMVVEVARALAAAGVKPRRTLVFANFSGEEIGLHGSKALADSPPKAAPFAKGKVVAMVNLDMVGRLDERGLAIGGVGSSPGWMPLLDAVGPHGLGVLYERSITTRSDHASFYRHDVPVLFFFTHLHPDYHRPGDEAKAINADGMLGIAELVADLVQRLGDGADVPFAKPKNADEGLVGSLPGTNPATVEKRVGLPEPKRDATMPTAIP